MIYSNMQYITTAFISLPLSDRDAIALGIGGVSVHQQVAELLLLFRAKNYTVEVGGPGLKWMGSGNYIYLRSECAALAEQTHSYLESINKRLADGVCIPTTWAIRKNEKHLDYAPSKGDMLALTKK